LRIELDIFDIAVRPSFADMQFGGGLAVVIAMQQSLRGHVD
jgi:hypothetical protein